MQNLYGPLTPTLLLQRTFALYRERPKLMFGLMLIVAAVELIVTAVITASRALFGLDVGGRMHPLQGLMFVCICLLAWLLIYLVSQVVHGAFFYAVTAELQQRRIRVGEACNLALERIGRLISVSVQVFLRILGYEVLFAILCGVVFLAIGIGFGVARRGLGGLHGLSPVLLVMIGALAVLFLAIYLVGFLWLCVRYAVAIPACLAENLPGWEAIRRSVQLSAKSRGRLYALYIFVGVLGIACAMIVFPIAILSMREGGHAAGFLLLNAVASAVNLLFEAWLLSFLGIASTLCYYDLRVRKEGWGAAATPQIGTESNLHPDLTPSSDFSDPLPPLPGDPQII